MPWVTNGTPLTLLTNASSLTLNDLTTRKFNVILSNNITNTLVPQDNIRIGNGSLDTGANYANRRNRNGTSETATPSSTSMQFGTFTGANLRSFGISYIINISGAEKLQISFYLLTGATGSGNVPDRQESVNKWADTVQFDNVGIINTNTGDYATGSNLSALGTD